ncbi:MAG: T9SS type A sorting domain-containing protein [bacterium]|nr:T9SS type A sorting domain-containing protein [bacterium]
MLSFAAVTGIHSAVDETVRSGQLYQYRLCISDIAGREWPVEDYAQSILVDASVFVPDEYNLYPPYPNPFNARTTFTYDLPSGSPVTLRVFDIMGRQVATLIDESRKREATP